MMVVCQVIRIHLYFGYSTPTHVPNWSIGEGVSHPSNTNPSLHSGYGQMINGEQVARIAHPSLLIADSGMSKICRSKKLLYCWHEFFFIYAKFVLHVLPSIFK
jgi:hypothetical protein